MNAKIWVGIGVVVLVALGWMTFSGNTTDYVADVTGEIESLELELAAIEAAVEAGTLTPAAAAEAQVKIAARLASIDGGVSQSQNAKLTPAQRAQLLAGLDRLKQVLTDYRATLVVVDEKVETLPEAQRPQLNRGGNGGKKATGIVAAIADTIAGVEDYVEDVLEEAVEEGDITETEMEDILEEAEVGTDEEMADDGTTDTEVSTEMPADDSETDEMIIEEVNIDAETELEATSGSATVEGDFIFNSETEATNTN